MQMSLFGGDDEHHCQYPHVEGLTGYRYGCRCERCSEAKARWRHPTNRCMYEGCAIPRMKWRRWCADHIPPPKPSPRAVRGDADCERCGRHHSWYESALEQNRPEIRDLYRRTCGGCRKPHIDVIKRHRLDTLTALRLLYAEHCELCGKPFPIDRKGRPGSAIDHDHHCCPGKNSCGACVRGIICHRCNHIIASVESIIDVGLEDVLAYLQHPTPPEGEGPSSLP